VEVGKPCDALVTSAKHKFLNYGTASGVYALEDRCKLAVAGDWGTGTDEAQHVTTAMKEDHNPDYTVHLGDVYYVGDQPELEENCLGQDGPPINGVVAKGVKWELGTKGSFALNGHHEMYACGDAYFKQFLPALGPLNPAGNPQGQKTSFFCLQNKYWKIVGLDTGYYSTGVRTVLSCWIWSKGTRVGEVSELPPRLVGIAQDITERKQSELDIARHLATAEAARAEAEALRISTLTLTKNLSMDRVLDTLLASLFEVVPYDTASVILTENDCLYIARTSTKTVQMLEGQRNTFLERVRVTRKSVFFPDTFAEPYWEDAGVLSGVRSWICVPLIASTERPPSERVLGLLSIGHSRQSVFSTEHFRVAQSLAISAAVAIQNARLYERAETYGAELEALIGKQGEWQARKTKNDA
jgi:hypothetical protein